MIRDELVQALRLAPTGLTTATLLAQAGIDAADADVAEGILLLSSEVGQMDGRWRLLDCGRIGRLLGVIEAHAADSGRKLFRAEAALASCSKRLIRSESAATPPGSIFNAMSRSSRVSCAR